MHSNDNTNRSISFVEFYERAPGFMRAGGEAYLFDPYHRYRATFVGLEHADVEQPGAWELVFTNLRRQARFSSGLGVPYAQEWAVLVHETMTRFSLISGGTRCYIALLPDVNHIILGKEPS